MNPQSYKDLSETMQRDIELNNTPINPDHETRERKLPDTCVVANNKSL